MGKANIGPLFAKIANNQFGETRSRKRSQALV